MLPGATLPKDPTVTVVKNSINCYVFASVTDPDDDVDIVEMSDQWMEISDAEIQGYGLKKAEDTTYYVYVGKTNPKAPLIVETDKNNDQKLDALFEEVKIADVPAAKQSDPLGNIVIKSAAIQSDNNTYAAAEEALSRLGAPKQ